MISLTGQKDTGCDNRTCHPLLHSYECKTMYVISLIELEFFVTIQENLQFLLFNKKIRMGFDISVRGRLRVDRQCKKSK